MRNKLGIIGGGQLARMETQVASRLGIDVTVIDPTENSPAAQVGANQIIAPYSDPDATEQLVQTSDFVTIDLEHINAELLCDLQEEGCRAEIHPDPETLIIVQDKFRQKEMLASNGIPVVEFMSIHSQAELEHFFNLYGSLMVKKRRGSYDGYGNFEVHTLEDIPKAMEHFGDEPIYAEKMVEFESELAVLAVRDDLGTVRTYDPVETVHKDSICHQVFAPARQVDDIAGEQARAIAFETMRDLRGRGVFAIEMMVLAGGKVVVNEIAPRVHNSGHLTIEAADTSQFEQHVRTVCGMSAGGTGLVVASAVMLNILGETEGVEGVPGLVDALYRIPEANIHWYGKTPSKVGRKLGHIVTVSQLPKDQDRLLNRAETARQLLGV